MITPEEVAARFDNRSAYTLISYGVVGLPLYRITAVALCLTKKSLDPINEFILRSIATGADSIEKCAGLLGLDGVVVESCLADLIRAEYVAVPANAQTPEKVRLRLAAKGRDFVREQEAVVPTEQTIVFYVDGLTRKPCFYPEEDIYKPRDLQDRGIPEVRPFPARPPNLTEIDIKDVIDVVRVETGHAESPRQLLRIQTIERRQRSFLETVALVYRAESGTGLQVAFAIDGRLSLAHEKAFARAEGTERSQIFRGLSERPRVPPMTELLGETLSTQVDQAVVDQRDPAELRREARLARAQFDSARRELAHSKKGSVKDSETEKERLEEVKQELDQLLVRPLTVYEHLPLLKDAILNSRTRVMIISPWIRQSVVSSPFIKDLERALARGVSVLIGYGLGEDRGAKKWDEQARQDLEKLAERSPNFTMRRFGDTHAKVLIKDSDYFVISSFNWLSFRGDRNQSFREEWGTLVRVPHVVNEYYQKMAGRFR